MQNPISVSEAVDIAVECFRAGDFETVRGVCDEILRTEPANVDALHLRGLANANCSETAQAIVDLKHALLIKPKDFELLNNLGNLYKGTGEFVRSRECYEAALEQEPDYHPLWFNLANVLVELGETERAREVYSRVIAMAPDFTESYFQLGMLAKREGKSEEAISWFKQCIARDTNHVDAQIEIGYCHAAVGKVEEALNAFKVAAIVDPEAKEKFAGTMHLLNGDLEEAAEFFSGVIATKPDDAFAYRNLGRALLEAGAFDDAILVYRSALTMRPGTLDVQLELGAAYAKGGYTKQAVEYFEHAAQMAPDSWIPILGRAIALLPDADAFDEAEAALNLSDAPRVEDAARALYLLQPDTLRRAVGDHRALMRRYAALVAKVMAAKYPQWTGDLSMPLRDPAGRIRVGVISRKNHDRHLWRTVSSGITGNLNTDKFQIFEYPTRGVSFDQLCSRIRGDYLHVLIFPDLDEVAWQMAALRLAPVQCTTWARTETTGLPTMDYFLSGELAEPADGATHYSERLIKLPNLFAYYDPQLDKKLKAKPGEVFADPIGVSDFAGTMVALQMDMPVVTMPGDHAKSRRTAAVLEQIGIPELIAKDKEEYDRLVEELSSGGELWKQFSARIADKKQWAFKDHEAIVGLEKWLSSLVS